MRCPSASRGSSGSTRTALWAVSTRAEETEEFVRPFRQEFRTAVEDFVRPMFVPGSDPRLVEHVVADMSAAPPEVAVEMMEHSVTNDEAILAALPQLQAPVVAINPDYRPNDIEALRRHGVEVVLMPGVGHFLMLEDPDTFNRLLGETVDGFNEAIRRGRAAHERWTTAFITSAGCSIAKAIACGASSSGNSCVRSGATASRYRATSSAAAANS